MSTKVAIVRVAGGKAIGTAVLRGYVVAPSAGVLPVILAML